MKSYIKTYLALLLAMLLLVGCSNPANETSNVISGAPNAENSDNAPAPDNHELIVPVIDECRISSKRTGTNRQGISTLSGGFEVTDTGSYWMCDHWLLYSDHNSDTVIKLCGRPDCTHSGKDCNAYVGNGVGVCYYNGYLYTLGDTGLIRMNLDGSDRLTAFEFHAFKAEQGCTSFGAPHIQNGVFSAILHKLDGIGRQAHTAYYYKLDGSVKMTEMPTSTVGLIDTDGDTFCGVIGYDGEESIYGTWDPDTNSTTAFFQSSAPYYTGYIGSEAIYYIENGIIYERLYATGATNALFDTGLDTGPLGNYKLSCFPDTLVISEYSDDKIEDMTLRFYDWNFNDLGSVHIDFPFASWLPSLICGETHERFMLTDSGDLAPRYYIEKSDLGTGNITIHEYEWDFEWE